MKSSKEQFQEMRQQEISEKEGIPMQWSAPNMVIERDVFIRFQLSMIKAALNEYISLLNEINKNHNHETLEGFWDYQTAKDASDAFSKLEELFKS